MAPRIAEALERLQAGACKYACGGYLTGLEPLGDIHAPAGENWNETFYRLYFRTLGDRLNLRAYLRLAGLVPYKAILRERLTPHAVEALLLGASGLLALCPDDEYTSDLRATFAHLSAKYGIDAMQPGEWTLDGLRPANHPVLRLAQAAAFFAQDQFVMARTLACRTEADIRKLFCIDAPDYWQKHCAANEGPRRLGAFKAHIIGINLWRTSNSPTAAIRARKPCATMR